MKIGVISDTHISVFSSKLPQKVYECFKDCDLIVHAGDAIEMSVIKELGKIAEVKAVRGNMDSRELKERFSEKIIFEAEGKKIGVVHGKGSSSKILRTVSGSFTEKLDIVIFGHSHLPLNEKKGDTLFFNPGSAMDRVCSPYCSIGIIYIEDGNIRGEIIKID
ncbi:MAG: metallophosphoesterase family protein [Candidatus Omnitrophica bacterium]|nr:metallophosphoesterase family protein [Candidatus Omnitrophota bacterium]